MRITFCDFEMNHSIVAPAIFGTSPHQTTNRGVVINQEVARELKNFLTEFNASVGIDRTPYYRIDAYFDAQTLWVLEINASFVDGWGTALNLARASGISVDPAKLVFPQRFATKNMVYRPELEVFMAELKTRGLNGMEICVGYDNDLEPIYVYGRVGSKAQPHILPYDGVRLDNKLNLALFATTWRGESVKIPRHYIGRFDAWEDMPQDVVLKFCDKESVECQRARQSVLFGKPSGKAPFLNQCYKAETLIVQEFIRPAQQAGNNCQLIIFVIGDDPITGYVQYSRSKIINDDSTHGPLQIH